MLIKRSEYQESKAVVDKEVHKCANCGKPVVCTPSGCPVLCPVCQKEVEKY